MVQRGPAQTVLRMGVGLFSRLRGGLRFALFAVVMVASFIWALGPAFADTCKNTQIMTSAPQPVYGPEDYVYQQTWQKTGTVTETVGAGSTYTVQEWQQVPVQTTSWVDKGSYQTRWAQTGTETYSYQVPYTASAYQSVTCQRTINVAGSCYQQYVTTIWHPAVFYSNSWSSPCGYPCWVDGYFENVFTTVCTAGYSYVENYECGYWYNYTAYRTEWATRATYGWLPFWVSNWQQVTTTTYEYQWVDVTKVSDGTPVTHDTYALMDDTSLPKVLSDTAVPNSYTAAVYDIKTICDLNPT